MAGGAVLGVDALAARHPCGISRIGPQIVEAGHGRLAPGKRKRRRCERRAQARAQPTRMQDIIPLAWCSSTWQ